MIEPDNRRRYSKSIKVVLLSTFKDKKIRHSFFWSILGLIIGAFANLCIPLILRELVESFSSKSSFVITMILFSYGLIWIVNQACLHVRALLTHRIEQRISFVLGIKILSHLYGMSYSYFLNQKPGALTSTIRKAQYSVPSIVLGLFFHVLPTLLEFLFVITLITVSYPFFYSLLMVGILVLFCFFTTFSAKSSLKDREKANEVERNVDGIVSDWLSNYEAVKVFGKRTLAIQTCEKELKKRESAEIAFMTKYISSHLGQSLILGIGFSALTYFVGQGVLQNTLTVGDFVLFNGYILQFVIPIGVLGQIFQNIKKGVADMKGAMDVLSTQSEVIESPHPLTMSGERFQISFEDVCCRSKDRVILEHISFKIGPEETVLIVGPTGAGKSTIAKLLLRLYDPTEGNIFVNKTNIKQFSFESLAETIAWVPQEGYLLNDSIENNLRFVCPNALSKDIERALDHAHLLKFAKNLPKGLNTIVGDRGLKLSGGEKQRISLARLFLKKPKICIFDESTSSLDKDTDLIIQDNIKEFLPQSTKIIITHRPFVAYEADQIIEIKKDQVLRKKGFPWKPLARNL